MTPDHAAAHAALDAAELRHYSRQTILPEIGIAGQQALKQARVLMVGAGGLGSPVGLYLAAAGVGTLGIVEFDKVEASNLHRQVLYGTDQLGRPKLDAAVERLAALNPHIRIVPHALRLDAESALELIADYDLVVDGTDNFASRFLINDACVLLKKRVVHASIFRFDGMVGVFGDPHGPCYRCLYPEPPPPGLLPSCADAGVLGVLPGIAGALQANEVIKLITGIGRPLIGRMLQLDALGPSFTELEVARDPDCPACGGAGLEHLVDYDQLCGTACAAGAADGIDCRELERRLAAGAPMLLLDVRSAAEHQHEHIPGSTLIPLDELDARLADIGEPASIVCYCHSGMRSARAAHLLRGAGHAGAVSLEGGMLAWLQHASANLPVNA